MLRPKASSPAILEVIPSQGSLTSLIIAELAQPNLSVEEGSLDRENSYRLDHESMDIVASIRVHIELKEGSLIIRHCMVFC